MALLSEETRTPLGAPVSRAGRVLRYLPWTAAAVDVVVMTLVGLIAVWWRETYPSTDILTTLIVPGPIMIVVWLVSVWLMGGYRPDVFGAGSEEFKRVFNASLVAAGLTGIGCYLAKFQLSRGFFVLALLLGVPALLGGRTLLRRAVHGARARGNLLSTVLIVGTGDHVDEIAAVLSREPWLGYRVIGALTPPLEPCVATPSGIAVLGTTDEVTEMAIHSGADVILLADGATGSGARLKDAMWELEQHSVRVVIAPSVIDISSERIRIQPVGGLPLVHIAPPTWSNAARGGKRLFDIVGALVFLTVFSPLFVVAALQIKLADRGPMLYRQPRIGRRGEAFTLLKFRTMVIDADAVVADMQAEAGVSAMLFKMKDDPRITRPGHWLRRFSVDELPQLWNVVRGDMSLVGPRPQVAREVALYDSSMTRRLHVRPGLTGLWQVSGRSDLSVEEAVRLDLFYVDNWSMIQDVMILARTFGAVVGSRGAY